MRFHTTISRLPIIAARCSEVLLLSSKFGFSRNLGLFFMIRFTSKTSFHRIALRKRTCTAYIISWDTGKLLRSKLQVFHVLFGSFKKLNVYGKVGQGPWNGVQMAAEKLTRGRKGNQNVVQESRVTLEHGFQKVERGDKS
ncbi:predicted protein [Histoplasma mississippiense (nom. inval.)]|uniref:predicted protein n=1 Tax=Ajellomyces capsulatus (strain NAm1 / WU24) TaxID=2059318 RepID=UPI000157B9EA|nr:predicted protein [Histoplasma mississippiense (nom. inval.)]EDN03379.1 predicted protein [Histoplasma mississippiense (nom. inval.)]